ncbi:unnamed protein product [Brassica oleracea var. botrytis]
MRKTKLCLCITYMFVILTDPSLALFVCTSQRCI